MKVLLLLSLWVCGGATLVRHGRVESRGLWQSVHNILSWITGSNKVTVSFFVMSKCPDAKVCEDTFLPVLKDLRSLVDVDFTYIGSKEGGQVDCMHGPSECDGDKQRLCMQKVAPLESLLNFAMCQDANQSAIAGNGEGCATQSGLSKEDLVQCVKNDGDKLLEASVQKASDLSITTSCTLRVNDDIFCVHDGAWRDCGSCGSDLAACLKEKVCSISRDPKKSDYCA